MTEQSLDSIVMAALRESSTLVAITLPIAQYKALYDWLREPDHVELADRAWLIDWMNRRPTIPPPQ